MKRVNFECNLESFTNIILDNDIEEGEFVGRLRKRLIKSAQETKSEVSEESMNWIINYMVNGNGKDIRGFARILPTGERVFTVDADFFDELIKQYP